MKIDFEKIIPWNGANDTGRDARLKLERNFEKVGATFQDIYEILKSWTENQSEKLSRVKEDTAQELITFLKGLVSEELIKALKGVEIGENGSGITVLENGMSQAVVDYLYVKVKAIFDELEVKKKTYVGGEQILSPAGMKCIRVEEQEAAYRCFFKAEEDGVEIENTFTVGQLAISQENNIKVGVSHHVGNRYYWREVAAVGVDYIDLSKTICDPNIENDIPAAGDDIVALGHATDITRQGAIVLSSVNEVAPSILMYQGINSFSLVEKDVIGFDYDKATGKARMRVYGDTYIGAKDKSEYIEYKNGKLNIKGTLHIKPGSTGFENITGDLEFGKINLLRNSGFAGDYNSASLEATTEVTDETELYNQAVKWWAATNVAINYEDAESISGRSATMSTGVLMQDLFYKLYEGEKYVLSFKAKGGSVAISVGGFEETQQLTDTYERYVHKFTAANEDTSITLSGSCTITEIQLERGTVLSAWSISPLDNNSFETKFEAMRYLTDAMREGSTAFIGGLGLTSMILVGNYIDGELKKVTGGLSGVYNDDDDVLLFGGGNLEQAINAVLACKEDPSAILNMSEAELAELAKVVLTHGGRAILNDVVIRGYIYALGGLFKGTLDVANGTTHIDEDGTGWIGKIAEAYFAKWDTSGNGSLCFGNIAWDAVKKLLSVKGKVEAQGGSKIGNLTIGENGAMSGGNAVFEDLDTFSPVIIFAQSDAGLAATYKTYIVDRIEKSTTIVIGGPKITSDYYTVNLPSSEELSTKGIKGGFRLTLIAVASPSLPIGSGVIQYSATFRITSRPKGSFVGWGPNGSETIEVPAGEIHDNNNNRVDTIDMAQGDVLELYYYGGIYYLLNRGY